MAMTTRSECFTTKNSYFRKIHRSLSMVYDINKSKVDKIITGSNKDKAKEFLFHTFQDLGIDMIITILSSPQHLQHKQASFTMGLYQDLLHCKDQENNLHVISSHEARKLLIALIACCNILKTSEGHHAKLWKKIYVPDDDMVMDTDDFNNGYEEDMEEPDNDINMDEELHKIYEDNYEAKKYSFSPTHLPSAKNIDEENKVYKDVNLLRDDVSSVDEDQHSIAASSISSGDDLSGIEEILLHKEDEDDDSDRDLLMVKMMPFGVEYEYRSEDSDYKELRCIPYPATNDFDVLSGPTLLAVLRQLTPVSTDKDAMWPMNIMIHHNEAKNKRGKVLDAFYNDRKNVPNRCFCLMSGKVQNFVSYDNRIFGKAKNKIFLQNRHQKLYDVYGDLAKHITSVAACIKGANAYTAQQTKERFRLVIDVDWMCKCSNTKFTINGEKIANFFAENIGRIVCSMIPSMKGCAATRIITTMSLPQPPIKGHELISMPHDDIDAQRHLQEKVKGIKIGLHISFCSIFVTRLQYKQIIDCIRKYFSPIYKSTRNPMLTDGLVNNIDELPSTSKIIDLLQSQNGSEGCSLRDAFTVKTFPGIVRLKDKEECRDHRVCAETLAEFGKGFKTKHGCYIPDTQATHKIIIDLYKKSNQLCKINGRKSKNVTALVFGIVCPSIHLPITIHHAYVETDGNVVIKKKQEELGGIAFTDYERPFARQGQLSNYLYEKASQELKILVQTILYRSSVAADAIIDNLELPIPQFWNKDGFFEDHIVPDVTHPDLVNIGGDISRMLHNDADGKHGFMDIEANMEHNLGEDIKEEDSNKKDKLKYESIDRPVTCTDGHLMSLIWQAAMDTVPSFAEFLHVTVPKIKTLLQKAFKTYFSDSVLTHYIASCRTILQKEVGSSSQWWLTFPQNPLLREFRPKRIASSAAVVGVITEQDIQRHLVKQCNNYLQQIEAIMILRHDSKTKNAFMPLQSTILMFHTLFVEDAKKFKTSILASGLLQSLFTDLQIERQTEEVDIFLETLELYIKSYADNILLGDGDMPWITNGSVVNNTFFGCEKRCLQFREEIRQLCTAVKFEIKKGKTCIHAFKISFPLSICKAKIRRCKHGDMEGVQPGIPTDLTHAAHGSSATTINFEFMMAGIKRPLPIIIKTEQCRSDKCKELGNLVCFPRVLLGETLIYDLCGGDIGLIEGNNDFSVDFTYAQPMRYVASKKRKISHVHEEPILQQNKIIESMLERTAFKDKTYFKDNGGTIGFANVIIDLVKSCKDLGL